MSAKVRPAVAADIDAVCRLLHEQMNRRLLPERWRRITTYGWLDEKPDFGRVVEDRGQIVGFVGSVYADREIGGRRERVVSMSSWYLDKAYRGQGLGFALMASATADESASYTMITVSPRNLAMLPKLGYQLLDHDRRVWSRSEGRIDGIEIEQDPARILPRVDARQQRMLNDHVQLPIHPVLISAGDGRCLAVFSIKRKREDITYFDALHLSDGAFFARHAQAIADALLPAGKALLAADTRLLGGEARGAVEVMPVARYYKSTRLSPAEVDNMYSELLLLDLKLD
jgi:GNAT superfamily N-acetyltransferase